MKKSYISVLNCLACFLVVLLHVNGDFWNYSKNMRWILSNLVECIGYCAVPIFFMISGVNLIGYEKKYSTDVYIKKRIKKTVIPYLMWTFLGILFLISIKKINLRDFSIPYIINGIINSGFIDVYWFFIPLFGSYIAIIFCSLIPANKRKNAYGALILWSGITMSIFPTIFEMMGIKYNNDLGAGLINGYFIFPLIGYWIDNYYIKKDVRMFIYFLGFLGFGLHFFGTAIVSDVGAVNSLFKGYTNFPSIFYSVAIFVLFKYCKGFNGKIMKVVNIVGTRTFGIYMIHIYIVKIIMKIGFVSYNLIIKFTISIVVFILAYIIVGTMQKIPGIRKMVP